MIGAKRVPEVLIAHDSLVLCSPMSVYPIPTISLKDMATFRANSMPLFPCSSFAASASYCFHCTDSIGGNKKAPPLDLRNGVAVHRCFIFPPIQGPPFTRAGSRSRHRVDNLLRSRVNFCGILGAWQEFVNDVRFAGVHWGNGCGC
jgi:hypothetical protein